MEFQDKVDVVVGDAVLGNDQAGNLSGVTADKRWTSSWRASIMEVCVKLGTESLGKGRIAELRSKNVDWIASGIRQIATPTEQIDWSVGSDAAQASRDELCAVNVIDQLYGIPNLVESFRRKIFQITRMMAKLLARFCPTTNCGCRMTSLIGTEN